MNKVTRFRAYQLGEKGASFSLAVDNDFTLIEARLNDCNRSNVINEMRIVGAQRISLLHITSWDVDHCNPDELCNILVEHTKQPFDKVFQDMDRDHWFTAQEAVDYGLVDKILSK